MKRLMVDDLEKKSTQEREQVLREKMKGKDANRLSQEDVKELVLLLAEQAGLINA